VEPEEGAELWVSVPRFRWDASLEANVEAMPSYAIQIARDPGFAQIVDEDRLAAVIAWYVPDRPLPPGDYHWRVATVDARGKLGPWSASRTFAMREAPALRIRAGATFEQVRETIREAAGQTPARVVFDTAEYRLDPGAAVPFIELADVEDLTIDGNGSTIILTRPTCMVAAVRCRRVVVQGLTIDFDPLPYTAGRVLAVDLEAPAIGVEILPGHPLPDLHARFAEDRKGMVVSSDEGYAIKRGATLVIQHSGFELMEGRRCRFAFESARQAAQFAPGDVYVLDPRWQAAGGGHGVHVLGGEDVTLLDLTIRAAANECLGSFYADRHAILHVRIPRHEGRALSVNNGGNNHHNARTGPWIEGCLFENTGDDICHVNGYAMSVQEQPTPDRVLIRIRTPYDQFCREAALDIRPGDRLQFFERQSGRLLGERGVEAAEIGEDAVSVSLDAAIDGIVPGVLRPAKGAAYAAAGNAEITQVFDVTRTCGQFVFRNNVCRNGRRVGVLAKGDRGLIEGNTFEGLGGGGVEFWNAPFEGLGAESYVVRGNRIANCLRLERRHAAIWATAFRPGGSRIHRNLLIEGNEIVGAGLPAMDLGDAENVVLRDNRIVGVDGTALAGEGVVVLRNVTRAQGAPHSDLGPPEG
jgi:hypothetical protein